TDVLYKAIRAVVAGRYWVGSDALSDLVQTIGRLSSEVTSPNKFGLTPREREITQFVVAGYSNKDIAASLNLREDTVKHHLTNIFDKTGTSSRLEFALFAMHHQIVSAAPASGTDGGNEARRSHGAEPPPRHPPPKGRHPSTCSPARERTPPRHAARP